MMTTIVDLNELAHERGPITILPSTRKGDNPVLLEAGPAQVLASKGLLGAIDALERARQRYAPKDVMHKLQEKLEALIQVEITTTVAQLHSIGLSCPK